MCEVVRLWSQAPYAEAWIIIAFQFSKLSFTFSQKKNTPSFFYNRASYSVDTSLPSANPKQSTKTNLKQELLVVPRKSCLVVSNIFLKNIFKKGSGWVFVYKLSEFKSRWSHPKQSPWIDILINFSEVSAMVRREISQFLHKHAFDSVHLL